MTSDNSERELIFRQIMGDPSMPENEHPDYDRWLFDKTYEAARQLSADEIERLNGVCDEHWRIRDLQCDKITRLTHQLDTALAVEKVLREGILNGFCYCDGNGENCPVCELLTQADTIRRGQSDA